jgi:hypothetical protein
MRPIHPKTDTETEKSLRPAAVPWPALSLPADMLKEPRLGGAGEGSISYCKYFRYVTVTPHCMKTGLIRQSALLNRKNLLALSFGTVTLKKPSRNTRRFRKVGGFLSRSSGFSAA